MPLRLRTVVACNRTWIEKPFQSNQSECSAKETASGIARMNKTRGRKKVYVDPKFQGELLKKISIYWVFYHLFLWHIMLVVEYWRYDATVSADITKAVPFVVFFQQFFEQYQTIIWASLIALPIFLYDLTKLSHRVVGPIVRFTQAMKEMCAREELGDVSLRDGDYLQEYLEVFNNYVPLHNKHVAKPKGNSEATSNEGPSLEEQILQTVQDLHQKAAQASPSDLTSPSLEKN